MGIETVQRLGRGRGIRAVPALDDYDARSEVWIEAEHRAEIADSSALVGFWEGEPGWVRFESWPYNEVCVILSGRVAVEDESGQRAVFGAGEAFVVPFGFQGTWHTLEPTEKIFVGIESHAAK